MVQGSLTPNPMQVGTSTVRLQLLRKIMLLQVAFVLIWKQCLIENTQITFCLESKSKIQSTVCCTVVPDVLKSSCFLRWTESALLKKIRQKKPIPELRVRIGSETWKLISIKVALEMDSFASISMKRATDLHLFLLTRMQLFPSSVLLLKTMKRGCPSSWQMCWALIWLTSLYQTMCLPF